MRTTYKGIFLPKHPEKYRGNVDNIIYRSGWEKKVMHWLDTNLSVVEWSSEELIIPYVSPADRRVHRYFPDFWARMRQKDGSIRTYVLEVKPKAETAPPEKKGRMTRRYKQQVITYFINQAKWKSALAFCEQKGWSFQVLTEDHIGV